MKTIDPKSGVRGNPGIIKLFLAGDVMTGRGIDQILPHPGDPTLYEDYIKDARGYVELAEKASGPVPRPAEPAYIWGEALGELEKAAVDVRIANLETSVTRSDNYWKWKEVHYRMNPANIDCLTAARIDVYSLANNHVLDWSYEGLKETLATLQKANIKSAGAGLTRKEAAAPAVVEIEGKGRVIVFAYGSPTSGIHLNWGATEYQPGLNLLADFSEDTVRRIRDGIRSVKKENDIIVFSMHWGANWGYEIKSEEIEFAHRLIESGVDIVHGHSSHHVKSIEVYQDRLILYGCGDFLNDYEGIPGYENYRTDLGLMYFAAMDRATGGLAELKMVPTRIKYLRVNRASAEEALLLADILKREGKRFGTEIELSDDALLTLVLPISQDRQDSARP
ncbi:MAG: poly-gamma-glutamate biosynthesis protein [Nitrospirae bacterium GWD2_57_9]|nr:MAG: poly-gamma-glutamate biosynthesis protein [Nitrospirae bacterium GWD2_57_9]OGW50581.1 MAG: poly-gamma-glutamate biosynthesis protein [Nitrospirae bacterium GWC2_57_9]